MPTLGLRMTSRQESLQQLLCIASSPKSGAAYPRSPAFKMALVYNFFANRMILIGVGCFPLHLLGFGQCEGVPFTGDFLA